MAISIDQRGDQVKRLADHAVIIVGVDENGKPAAVSVSGGRIISADGGGMAVSRGVAGAAFTSADQHSAVASVTDAPTTGKKLVLTDIEISVDTAMRVDLMEETSGTLIDSVYMAANSTVNLVTRGKKKLATANKKLQVQTSVAGNITVNALYYSEA